MADEKPIISPAPIVTGTPATEVVKEFPTAKVVELEKEIAQLRKNQTDGQGRLDSIGQELQKFIAGKVTAAPPAPEARKSFLEDCLAEFNKFWFGQ